MGASREGTMNVREKIHLVLLSQVWTDEIASTINNGDGSAASKNSSWKCWNTSPLSFTALGDENKQGLSGNRESAELSVPLPENSEFYSYLEITGLETGSVLQESLRDHLLLIRAIGERLKNAESRRETVCQERDQMKAKLTVIEDENASLKCKYTASKEEIGKADAVIKVQAGRILEFEQQLHTVVTAKPVEEKSTCITPPPLRSPSSSPSLKIRKEKADEVTRPQIVDYVMPNDKGQENVDSIVSSIHPSYPRRSDSPPQLSPAVTPRPLSHSIYNPGGRRTINNLLHTGDDSDDEFEDELRHLTHPAQPQPMNPSSSLCVDSSRELTMQLQLDSRFDQQPILHSPCLPDSKAKKRRLEPDSHNYSGPFAKRPSLFARPMRPRFSRFMSPAEARRRFVRKSSLSRYRNTVCTREIPMTREFSPRSKQTYDENCSSISSSLPAASTALRQPPQLISIRNNNFLNVNRPIPRKTIVDSLTGKSTAIGDGELNYSNLLAGSLDSHENHSELQSKEEIAGTNVRAENTKKRSPGRPVGSSSLKYRLPGASFPSPKPGPSSFQPRVPNGIGEQRFSQRGRLLKPNRARYSPDPDISMTSHEKCLTTKKSYYVTDPFVQDEYSETGGEKIAGDVEEEEEEEIQVYSGEIVEVPKWRISIVEGYKEGEERVPPDDDMSDEAFFKRHQKLEIKEKQRKRWDSQRMREESYLEKLKRKQEERERQKELRRLRKRKGKSGCTSDDEQESLLPRIEDIKAIHVSKELPVGIFGFQLPLVEKVDFQLSWIPPTSVSINNVNDSSKKKECEEEICTTTTTQPPCPSPKSSISSSSSLPSIPSPSAMIPTSFENPKSSDVDELSEVPPVKDRDRMNKDCEIVNRIIEDSGEDITGVKLATEKETITVVNKFKPTPAAVDSTSFDVTTTFTIAEDGELDCNSPSPLFTIDLVDFRNENACGRSSDRNINSDDNNCSSRSSSLPPSFSSTIPPETCTSSTEIENSVRNNPGRETVSSSCDLKFLNSGEIKKESPCSASSSNTVSTTSITFLIPANPLAPRHSHLSLTPTKSAYQSCSNKQTSPCPSPPKPTRSKSLLEECCKDNDRS